MLDPDACHAALVARDARFDGLFFVGVATTGIYCRPICPARTPGRDRCSFHPCAAAAERAGFRACLRCRPELAPGAHDGAAVDAIARLVERAAALIDEGYLNERGVDDLAARLGVSARHLRRATEARLGVSPVELAQTRRLALAKQLLHDTRLGLAELAHASGFASVRRFNAAFRASFARAPSELRREHAPAASPALRLRLDHREPHDWPRLLAFLRARAIPGVELVRERSYHRVVHIGGHTGLLHVSRDPKPGALQALVSPALAPVLMPLVARLRRAFDLDARPDAIARDLGRDPLLAPHLRARPGLRVPGSFDDFEIAARAVLGQQVSVRAATTLAGRLVARFGVALPDLAPGLTGLTESHSRSHRSHRSHRVSLPVSPSSLPVSPVSPSSLPVSPTPAHSPVSPVSPVSPTASRPPTSSPAAAPPSSPRSASRRPAPRPSTPSPSPSVAARCASRPATPRASPRSCAPSPASASGARSTSCYADYTTPTPSRPATSCCARPSTA
jgi:AraC family transcriptional regulator of adaptative response / DNA-3-methyladenine glycosylase II